ncbi:MAG: YitT family protein [Lachnospiraceae bacterium]|nr:YitT family protein [Lachnospiraceae bacterium]
MRNLANKKIIKRAGKYMMMTIAAFLYAVAISLFLDPNNIAPGGITGVSILINRFIPVPVGTLNLILNVPIILLGLWKFGFKFIFSTMYTLLVSAVFIDLLAPFGAVTNELLIASVLGGILLAVSLAVIFKAGATTGGTDIVVKVLQLKWKHMKTGEIFLFLDLLVVLASWLVFKDMTVAFYAGVAVVIDMVVMDYVLYGPDEAKVVYIISDNTEQIKQRILVELDISATLIQARGAYTGDPREVVMVVVRKQMAPRLEEIVKEEDPRCFMLVSSASEIFGEGYKDIRGKKV